MDIGNQDADGNYYLSDEKKIYTIKGCHRGFPGIRLLYTCCP